MLHRLIVALILAAVLAPAAHAQQNPFQQLPPAQPETQTVEVTPTTDEEDDGLERWQQLLIFGGGVLFIGAIGFAIMHDARRRAPVADERAYYRDRSSDAGATTKRKVDRKKSKAQKAARKRQRARR